MKFCYLVIDLATLCVPLLFSFHPRINFTREWKFFLPANLIVALFFIGWDILFTHFGYWDFNSEKVLGYFFLDLPLEEYLFFFCIPYACIFTWHCIGLMPAIPRFHKSLVLILCACTLFIFAGIFRDRMYTLYCFSLTALLLFLYRSQPWMPTAIPVFLILLIPFLLVNGLLTATDEPVVTYSPRAIIGYRIYSIPVEDIFYALSLYLSNLWLYKKLGKILPGNITKHAAHHPVHL